MSNKEIVTGIIIGLFFISIVVLFCFLLVKLYIRKTKQHNQKELDFQKTLTQTIVETQEQVLNNLAQDLHDDAGQQLTAINFQLEHLKLDEPQWQSQLQPISDSLNQLSQTIRSLSHSLTHQFLLQQDLSKVISNEIDRLKRYSRVIFSFHHDDGKNVLSDDEKIILYRIFQECLNNSIKHAKAKHIKVHLLTSTQTTLIVTDDGQGFDVDWQQNSGFGLSTMRQRATWIGYELTVVSQSNEGTEIIVMDKRK